MMKLSGLFLMLVSFAGMVNLPEHFQQKRTERQSDLARSAPNASPRTKQRSGTMDSEVKQLVAGQHCAVVESFIFVARDVQTYRALQSLNITLPEQDADFFKAHAVIAAFLGQRNTGGFSVDITQGADGVVRIAEQKARGMVAQVLTTPFKIVAIPTKTDVPIALSLDATWTGRTYRVTSGELTITGGFAGVHEKLTLSGTLQVMRATLEPSPSGQSPLHNVTLLLDLHSDGKRSKQLRDVVSGTVTESGQVNLSYLDSHTLSGAVQSPFRGTGQFTPDEQELSLNLETVSKAPISDNFTARASLRATAIPRHPVTLVRRPRSRSQNRAVTSHQ